MSDSQTNSAASQYPLLPLRDVVVFPHMVIPLFVGRPKSIKAMESAMEAGKSILLVAQKSAAKDDPGPQDMYEIGCVSSILQMLKLPDGTVKVLVEGGTRARIEQVIDLRTHWVADAQNIINMLVRTVEVTGHNKHWFDTAESLGVGMALHRCYVAHIEEQLAGGRLIRPRGEYTGPRDRTVVPLAQRS